LVLGGCGSAVWAAVFPLVGIGLHGVALFVGDSAVAQMWLFCLAPIAGAVLGAGAYRLISSDDK
jgi:hypothetical protein